MEDSELQQTEHIDVMPELLEPALGVVEVEITPVGSEVLLPFERMDEYNFERLCTRLVSRQAAVEEARRYGTRGQKQYGIDIYARVAGTDNYWVYQCKRYQSTDEKELKEILEKFLKDQQAAQTTKARWLERTVKFTLCITLPLEKTQFTNTLENLRPQNLELDLWDSVRLTELLKNQPEIVEEFFGRDAAESLCGAVSLLDLPLLSFDPKKRTAESRLLVASFRAVGFEGRKAKLDWLENWCQEGDWVRSHLITGDGGAGKTRLALELAIKMRGKGWVAGFIRSDSPAVHDKAEWKRMIRRGIPTLLIADYAETTSIKANQDSLEPPLLALRDALDQANSPVRLLLLSREAGSWFDELCGRNTYVHAANKEKLPAPDTILESPDREQTQALRATEFERARNRFADILKLTPPPAPLPNLSHPDFGRVLLVHMLALLACHEVPMSHPTGDDVLEALLKREREKFWEKLVGPQLPRLDGVQRIMTLITLGYPVEGPAELGQLIEHEPMLKHDLTPAQKSILAEGLLLTYPSPNLNSPQPIAPDLLAEHMIAATFFDKQEQPKTHSDWIFNLAFGTPENEVVPKTDLFKALPHLARLTQRKENIGLQLLERVVSVNPPVYAFFLFDLLPEQTVSMRQLKGYCGRIVEQIARTVAKDNPEEVPRLARILNNLGNRLSDLGRRAEALEASQEALEIRRKLAQTNPDAFLPYVATSLNNLGNRLSALGRRAEALEVGLEGVAIYRELYQLNPDAFAQNLVMGLGALGNTQEGLGQVTQACASIEEGLRVIAPLVALHPQAFDQLVRHMATQYIERCEKLGREPDSEILGQIMANLNPDN